MEGISKTILLPSKIGSKHYVFISVDDFIVFTVLFYSLA